MLKEILLFLLRNPAELIPKYCGKSIVLSSCLQDDIHVVSFQCVLCAKIGGKMVFA
jgi:hypothetical protein